MESQPSELDPAALRGFFERRAPLGTMRGLTYFAFRCVRMWESVERAEIEQLKTLVVLMAIFIEQTAVDGGSYAMGWLLTGLPQPPFHAVQ